MKTEFVLELFDNEKNREKLKFMNQLEILFDDIDNQIPEDFYFFTNELPFGSKVKITFELIKEEA